MANALDRDLQVGEILVLREELFKPEYKDLSYRLFEVSGGFGMKEYTMGNALYGKFLSDGEQCRYEGYEISEYETNDFQALLTSFDTVAE